MWPRILAHPSPAPPSRHPSPTHPEALKSTCGEIVFSWRRWCDLGRWGLERDESAVRPQTMGSNGVNVGGATSGVVLLAKTTPAVRIAAANAAQMEIVSRIVIFLRGGDDTRTLRRPQWLVALDQRMTASCGFPSIRNLTPLPRHSRPTSSRSLAMGGQRP